MRMFDKTNDFKVISFTEQSRRSCKILVTVLKWVEAATRHTKIAGSMNRIQISCKNSDTNT